MLTSLTVTGLQKMIDLANRYITDHGLKCNPDKTECAIFGKDNSVISSPGMGSEWSDTQ